MMPARASRGRLRAMNFEQHKSGLALVKRSAWLGARLAFYVLAPLCFLLWIGFSSMILYKSASFGVWPLELIRVADIGKSELGEPTHMSRIVRGMFAPYQFVGLGMVCSAITGAVIGAIAAGVRRLRRR